MVLRLAGRGLAARAIGIKAVVLLGGGGTGVLVAGIVLILVLAIGLGDGAQRDLDNSVYVHVRDPEMGRERHLWDTLRSGLREDEQEQESGR